MGGKNALTPMAVTTDPFSGSDVAGFIPELWPGLINEALFAKATAANFFMDLTAYARNGGDIIHVPDVFTNLLGSTPGAADTQSTEGAEVTTASPAQVDVTLTINTHKYLAFIIGSKDMAQLAAQYDFNRVYIDQAAGLLRKALETDIYGLWSGLSTNSSGDTATVLSDAEVRYAIYLLENLNFQTLDGDVAWHIHPYVWYNQLAAISKYYDQSQRGPLSAAGFTATGLMGEADIMLGRKGTIYGIPAYVSTNVVSGLQTYRNLLAHKSALGFATQMLSTPGSSSMEASRVRADSGWERRNIGFLTVVDMIYGVAELRDQAAVVVNASSAFLGS